MATSATIYSAYGTHSRLYLSWQVSEQDVANNRTLIKWQAGIRIDPGGWYWGSNAVKIYSMHINGGGSLGSGTWSNISGTGNHQLKSGSKWVTHSSDGTKSFSADLSGWLYGDGNRSASGSWSLPTIPRNSQVTTSASSYVLGAAIPISTNRKSSSFSHTITIRQNNSSGTIIRTINSVGASVTWTPSESEITTMQGMIPNSNSLTIYINQYNNQVKENSHVSVTLNLTEANPTFTTFTYKDSDTATAAITGDDQVLVKGKSTLEVNITSGNKMAAIKSATEDHYSIAYDGISELEDYSSGSTVTSSFTNIDTIGNRTIQVTAYDSRNNATKVSQDVTVYDYAAPTIKTTLTRENNFESDTTIHIEGTYSQLIIGGSPKNSLQTSTLQYRYKEDGGSFGSWVTKTFTDGSDGTFSVADFVLSLDNTKKYIFEFHVDDSFGTFTNSNSVDIGTPIFFIGQSSGVGAVGINKMPEEGALDVGGDIYSSGVKVLTETSTRLLGRSVPSASYENTTGSATEWTNSRLTVDVPYDGANIEVRVSLGSKMSTGSSWCQSVIELRYEYDSVDTYLTRRVQVRAAPSDYSGSSDMAYTLLNRDAGSYEFYLIGRCSVNCSKIYADNSANNELTAKLV